MKMYRKRFIPEEIVDISSDEVIHMDADTIITKWVPIKPRWDISGGVSLTLLKQGIKVSKFLDKDGNFAYWYCDIIEYSYDSSKDEYLFTDLLVDVTADKNWNYEVLDLDELANAHKLGLITAEQLYDALGKLNRLLEMIKSGEIQNILKKYNM
ncbi:MAG: DUF402 domain-containing protein [Clostridia bacterium]|nr:DUF402 domain-containing protein [Clostridia bacterium]